MEASVDPESILFMGSPSLRRRGRRRGFDVAFVKLLFSFIQ